LKKGYEVARIFAEAAPFNTSRLEALYSNQNVLTRKCFWHYGDLVILLKYEIGCLKKIEPDEDLQFRLLKSL